MQSILMPENKVEMASVPRVEKREEGEGRRTPEPRILEGSDAIDDLDLQRVRKSAGDSCGVVDDRDGSSVDRCPRNERSGLFSYVDDLEGS